MTARSLADMLRQLAPREPQPFDIRSARTRLVNQREHWAMICRCLGGVVDVDRELPRAKFYDMCGLKREEQQP
jgi:hypothetical protein